MWVSTGFVWVRFGSTGGGADTKWSYRVCIARAAALHVVRVSVLAHVHHHQCAPAVGAVGVVVEVKLRLYFTVSVYLFALHLTKGRGKCIERQ